MHKNLIPSGGQELTRNRLLLAEKLKRIDDVSFDSGLSYQFSSNMGPECPTIRDIVNPHNIFGITFARGNTGKFGTLNHHLTDIVSNFGDIHLLPSDMTSEVKVELVLENEFKFSAVSSFEKQIRTNNLFTLTELIYLLRIQDYKSDGRLSIDVSNCFLVNMLGGEYLFQITSDTNFQGWSIRARKYSGNIAANPVCCLHIRQ